MKRLLLAVFFAASMLTMSPACAVVEEPRGMGESPEINPRYLLTDSKGRTISNEEFPGRFQLITFGYTHCPDICPTTLAAMSLILGRLGKKAARVQAIFVTLDPERDSAAVLSSYTQYFDPRIIGLTGSPELVRSAADHFKVTYRKFSEPGAAKQDYSVDHSVGMYLLGPKGEFVTKFAYSMAPQDIATRIETIMGQGGEVPRPARR